MSEDRFAGIRRLWRIRDPRRDVAEELEFHFTETVRELVERGWREEEAVREAHRRFGDERRWRRELESIDRLVEQRRRLTERSAALRDDVRYALRRVRRSPGLAAAVVLTFALGIGANASIFGIVDRLLLRPPEHIADPERVQRLLVERQHPITGERQPNSFLAYPDFKDFEAVDGLAGVAAYSRRELTLGRGADAERVNATLVTGNFFSLLGVQPARGRFFTPEEERLGGPELVVVGHGYWQRRLGGDPDVIGETLDFGQGPYTIVGVAPRNFTGVDLRHQDLWLPMAGTREKEAGTNWVTRRSWYWLEVVGRTRPAATPELVAEQATAVHRAGRAEAIASDDYDANARVIAAPLIAARGPLASEESAVAKWLSGVSLLVLLIACANVANLLLARALRERREVTVRMALGISRGRLLAQTLTESLTLALLGGLAAIAVTYWGGAAMRTLLLPDVAWGDSALERRVLFAILGLSLLAGLISGIVPSLQSLRRDLLEALRSSGRSVTTPISRLRAALTVTQAALSVVLLVGAGLFVRSLDRVQSVDIGLDIEGVHMIQPIFDADLAAQRIRSYYERAVEAARATPAVSDAAAVFAMPFWSQVAEGVRVPGLDSLPRAPGGGPYYRAVTAGYFSTFGLRILRGRGFDERDTESAPPVVLVNATMARTVWPGEDPLGRCIIRRDPEPELCSEVIGVVEDAAQFSITGDRPAMEYYLPIAQDTSIADIEALVVRASGDPAEFLLGLRHRLLALDPAVRFVDARSIEEIVAPQLRSWRLGASMFAVFGALALVVAAVGLYSVLAFAVVQRTHELGVRSALGAPRQRLVRLVLGQGMHLVVLGLGLGILAALFAAPRIESLLYETSPRDPLTLLSVATTLLLVALLASALPAWRATRVPPSIALRAE
ncbi:MAG: ADOP family duplicated permease [Longimicrobiales bacterium]